MDSLQNFFVDLTGFNFQQILTIAAMSIGTAMLFKIFGKILKTVLILIAVVLVLIYVVGLV